MIREVRIGWAEGTSWISRMINRIDASEIDGNKVPSRISHTYLRFIFENEDEPTWVYESLISAGVRPSPFSHLMKALKDGRVRNVVEKPLAMTSEEMQIVWDRAVSTHGKGYDRKLVLLYYIWQRVFKGRFAARLLRLNNPDKYTCNEFVFKCLTGVAPELEHVLMKTKQTPENLFKAFVGVSSALFLRDVKDGAFIEVQQPPD